MKIEQINSKEMLLTHERLEVEVKLQAVKTVRQFYHLVNNPGRDIDNRFLAHEIYIFVKGEDDIPIIPLYEIEKQKRELKSKLIRQKGINYYLESLRTIIWNISNNIRERVFPVYIESTENPLCCDECLKLAKSALLTHSSVKNALKYDRVKAYNAINVSFNRLLERIRQTSPELSEYIRKRLKISEKYTSWNPYPKDNS